MFSINSATNIESSSVFPIRIIQFEAQDIFNKYLGELFKKIIDHSGASTVFNNKELEIMKNEDDYTERLKHLSAWLIRLQKLDIFPFNENNYFYLKLIKSGRNSLIHYDSISTESAFMTISMIFQMMDNFKLIDL